MKLLRSAVVRPLAEDWRETLDALARARGWPTSKETARLAARVAALSQAYNAGNPSGIRSHEALSARLGFSFVRDVPKTAGAVRELVAAGALRLPPGRSLRVLDLGAGLGASTWGVWAALTAAHPGAEGGIESTCVDDDGDALSVAVAIAEARRRRDAIEVRVEARRAPIARGAREARGPFDLVLLGQVLSELEGEGEATQDAALVRAALEHLAPDGSLVIVEPALRVRTRRLHRLRDALLAAGGVNVFAPCVHERRCPALADEGAWCHEDLDVDLPAWLAPIAARAGLRWQGLTFSYLVLRKDGASLRRIVEARGGSSGSILRVVSAPIVTKGKREFFVCGDLDEGGRREAGRVRARRLDRDATAANAGFDELSRGDLLAVEPALSLSRPRVGRNQSASRATPDAAGGGIAVDAEAHEP